MSKVAGYLIPALVVGAALGLVLIWELPRQGGVIAELQDQLRAEEAARLAAEGKVAGVVADRERLQEEARQLQKQLGEQAGKVEIREVTRWRTREVVVHDGGGIPVDCDSDGTIDEVVCPEVRVQVTGVEARVETQGGHRLAVGEVTVTRTSPPPPASWRLPFETERLLIEEPEPARSRWMLGPAVGITDATWAVGATAMAPEIRLGRLEARPAMTVVVGPSGGYALTAGLVFGWSR